MKSLNIDIVNTLRDDSDKISNSENFNSETIDVSKILIFLFPLNWFTTYLLFHIQLLLFLV